MGIVTTFHLQTVPAPRTAISFSVDIPSTKSKTATQRTNIFLAMQEYGLKADEKIGLSLYTDVSTFAISGVYWGDLAGYRAAIAPLVKLLPAGTQLSEKSAGWLQTLKEMSYSPTLDVPLSGYDLHETFVSAYIVQSVTNGLRQVDVNYHGLCEIVRKEYRHKSEQPLNCKNDYAILRLPPDQGSQSRLCTFPSPLSSLYLLFICSLTLDPKQGYFTRISNLPRRVPITGMVGPR